MTGEEESAETEDACVEDRIYTAGLFFLWLFLCLSLFIAKYRLSKKRRKEEEGW